MAGQHFPEYGLPAVCVGRSSMTRGIACVLLAALPLFLAGCGGSANSKKPVSPTATPDAVGERGEVPGRSPSSVSASASKQIDEGSSSIEPIEFLAELLGKP